MVFSANATFRNQARLLDMARLSSNPKDETGATGKLGYGYLLEFMQKENRTKDDIANFLRFSSWLQFRRGSLKIEQYVDESMRLINEFEQDQFASPPLRPRSKSVSDFFDAAIARLFVLTFFTRIL